jgi:hypothetical protein
MIWCKVQRECKRPTYQVREALLLRETQTLVVAHLKGQFGNVFIHKFEKEKKKIVMREARLCVKCFDIPSSLPPSPT